MSAASNHMQEIVGPHSTKSDKMRALSDAGYPRAEIARFLNVKYQFVRNVLEADKQKLRLEGPSIESAAPPLRIGNLFQLRVGPGGVVQIPRDVLQQFGLEEGRIVVADLEGEVLHLLSPRESVRRAQALIPPWREGEPLLSEQLIAERRLEGRQGVEGG